MPHLTIEYSANLPHYPEAETLTALNTALCAHPQVQDEADLKTRFIVADSFEIGIAPANRAFVHAQLRLLAGRTHLGIQGVDVARALRLVQRFAPLHLRHQKGGRHGRVVLGTNGGTAQFAQIGSALERVLEALVGFVDAH